MHTLAEILIIRGLMPIESIDEFSGDPTVDEPQILEFVDRGILSEIQVASARAAQAGLPFVELVDYPIDRAALALVPAALCRRHEVLPLAVAGNTITVAMADPGDVFALDDIRAASRMRVIVVVAEPTDLRNAMNRLLRADGELSDLTNALEEESKPAQEAAPAVGDAFDDDAPIVRFVNLLISQAIQDRASDIHIEPAEHDMGVRYRIDGVLHQMQRAPKNVQNGVISRLKIMSDIDIAERRRPQDGRMSIMHGGRQIDLRVATLPTVYGEKVVMRILDNSNTRLGMEQLGLLDRNAAAYEKSYSKPYGMILVTGPTGSGKSTTLYTTLHAVAKPEINVITVEDPVEYRMAGINQVQVNPKAGLTFATGLRTMLRADPDIIMVGEIRDPDTAKIAVEAALTGHLVLSTLHTNDAPSAITRLTEMGIPPFLTASAIDCVVAQRLARRLCAYCKKRTVLKVDRLRTAGFFDAAFDIEAFEPVGCARCGHSGYKGRVGLYEVMTVSDEIREMTIDRVSSDVISAKAVEQGMRLLKDDGLEKVRLGVTSIQEISRVT
jgi:type IV pilus assembly protein PilB